jgi:hypothetical protein
MPRKQAQRPAANLHEITEADDVLSGQDSDPEVFHKEKDAISHDKSITRSDLSSNIKKLNKTFEGESPVKNSIQITEMVVALAAAGADLHGKINNDGRFELEFNLKHKSKRTSGSNNSEPPSTPRSVRRNSGFSMFS